MANWTLQHLNCLVRKYTHLAEGRMTSLTQWTWVWGNSGRQWRTGKPGVLQSMRSQSVRHDWVTEQQSKNTRNVQACSLFSLSSLLPEKGKKKNSFLFFFFSFSLQHPHPEAALPSLVAEPRHPGPPTSLVLQWLSALPQSLWPVPTLTPLYGHSPGPSPIPPSGPSKLPAPMVHLTPHLNMLFLKHKPDRDFPPPVMPHRFSPFGWGVLSKGIHLALMKLLALGFWNTEHLSRTQHETPKWDLGLLLPDQREQRRVRQLRQKPCKVASPLAVKSPPWDLREGGTKARVSSFLSRTV